MNPDYMSRYYTVAMDDGNVYGIPADVIADRYAKHMTSANVYADDNYFLEDYVFYFSCMISWFDLGRPDFADWTKNNLNWEDVEDSAVLIRTIGKTADYQECWINGDYGYEKFEREVKVGI